MAAKFKPPVTSQLLNEADGRLRVAIKSTLDTFPDREVPFTDFDRNL